MDTKNLTTKSNTEMIAVSRAEYEQQQKRMAALEHSVSELEQQNQWLLELTVIAYNVLRLLGQETVRQGKAPAKRSVKRKRIRTVIQNLIHCAARIVSHARQTFLCLSRSNAWAECFLGLARRFC